MTTGWKRNEKLAGTDFILRPILDELLTELGEPPLGFPKECEFAWPTEVSAKRNANSPERFLYVADASKVSGDIDDSVIIELPSLRSDYVEEIPEYEFVEKESSDDAE